MQRRRKFRLRRKAIGVLLALSAAACLSAQTDNSKPSTQDPQQVVAFLNQSIEWYRGTTAEQRLAQEPTEVLFVYNNKQLANQALSLSFDYARAMAEAIASQNPAQTRNANESAPSNVQNIAQLVAKADDTVQQKQSAVDALKAKLPRTAGRARTVLESNISAAQSELDLLETRRDTLKTILQFATGANQSTSKTNDLLTQVDELEQSVPEARTDTSNDTKPPQQNSSNANPSVTIPTSSRPPASGIIGLASDLWDLRAKAQTLNSEIEKTEAFKQVVRSTMSPLVKSLQQAARQANDLASQTTTTAGAAAVNQRIDQIDQLQAQFKQSSGIFLPLAKESILLDRYRSQLTSWLDLIDSRQKAELKSLAVRLITLAFILLVAAAISELWRRGTVRYVPDVRRRHQFLLVRRIVMFCVYAIIIAFSFSTDLGSFTTFAGLIVAGLAVSLQNVIQSAVGYFVLLGKYGLRVGDRIQIGGTTGNVVDIDLMRLSLMELADSTTGIEGMPTGRTVEFPNAIIFQPTAGFFKQIPGTDFRWHEVTMTLATDSDYTLLEKRILKAVNAVFATYRDNLEQQYRRMERTLNLPVEMPSPQTRLRFTQSSLELIIRYPVTREHVTEIDDQITRALLDVMKNEPEVRSVGSPSSASSPALASPSAPATQEAQQGVAAGKK